MDMVTVLVVALGILQIWEIIVRLRARRAQLELHAVSRKEGRVSVTLQNAGQKPLYDLDVYICGAAARVFYHETLPPDRSYEYEFPTDSKHPDSALVASIRYRKRPRSKHVVAEDLTLLHSTEFLQKRADAWVERINIAMDTGVLASSLDDTTNV